jgi:hypothetical protein
MNKVVVHKCKEGFNLARLPQDIYDLHNKIHAMCFEVHINEEWCMFGHQLHCDFNFCTLKDHHPIYSKEN